MSATKWYMVAFALWLAAAGCSWPGARRGFTVGQHAYSFTTEITTEVTLGYLLYLPDAYATGDADWPLVVFLHGAGERGDDLELVKKHGPPKLIAHGEKLPFIVVSPQCPAGGWWTNQVEALDALLDMVVRRCRVDEERIYVTGLSMGGFGTWALAFAQPDRFAAIAPICGGGDPDAAERIAHLPVWVFHGARDNVVDLEESRAMVDALKAAGGAPRFTVYPDAGHNSWTATYENQELYDWLLRQRRQK
jgi:predicted peptidase